MRKAKWKSRGINDLDKAEELYESKTSCWICGSSDNLHLDHCHISGSVRGILCRRCNMG